MKAVYALTSCLISNQYQTATSAFISASHKSRASPSLSLVVGRGYGTTTTTTTTKTTNKTNITRRNMSTTENDSSPVIDIGSNLEYVNNRITEVATESNRPPNSVRLIAVSKTKPIEPLLNAAYEAGQRYFGENYAQELMQKANEMPKDIKWHFIGPLQSNKAAPLVKSVGLDQLACIETVCTMKLANKLNNAVASIKQGNDEAAAENEKCLGIYIQVNTSGEESKSGMNTIQECMDLVEQIKSTCTHLRIDGVMTIGAPGDYTCFDTLVNYRKEVADALGVDVDSLELSMGMSGDYEEAIKRGATNVRVGSTVFGARDYSNKK